MHNTLNVWLKADKTVGDWIICINPETRSHSRVLKEDILDNSCIFRGNHRYNNQPLG